MTITLTAAVSRYVESEADSGIGATVQPEMDTVLLVDDDALVRAVAVAILANAGFKVIEAANGDDAVVELGRHPQITVLFTDVDMPGSLDGFALARLAAERFPHLAILVGSGKMLPHPDDLPHGSMFIPKPYRQGTVVQMIRQLSAERQARR
jgi:two-component system, response regulator PdtaR